MVRRSLEGIIPVLAMPFSDAGRVDVASFHRLCAHLLGTGVAGLMLFGIASEFYKLTDAEKTEIEDAFFRASAGGPVLRIVSVTEQAWEVAVEHLDRAQRGGADGVNVFPPYFMHPSEDALMRHITALAECATVPMMVQYAPKEAGGTLPPEFFANLARRYPMIRAVKVEAQPPEPFIGRLKTLCPNLQTFVGYGGLHMLTALNQGAGGVQPGCSFAEVYQAIWTRHQTGQHEAAVAVYDRLSPYLERWMQHPEYIIAVEKTILYRRELINSAYCRGDRYRLDASDYAMIDRFCIEFAEYWEPGAPLRSSQTERGSS